MVVGLALERGDEEGGGVGRFWERWFRTSLLRAWRCAGRCDCGSGCGEEEEEE